MLSGERIKQAVKQAYTKVAQGTGGCELTEGGCGGSGSYLTQIGYSAKELATLPQGTVDSAAGCGNPTALAQLRPGQIALDLGSGAGIDVFLAAQQVGPQGKVIGVDMTEAMVEKARANALKMGTQNVEFRLGEIEALPVEDESVDVIISNCVINLAPDKGAVFREAFRVLRPGGWMMISDLVTRGELPEEIRKNLESWLGCVSGALEQGAYLRLIQEAGFKEIQLVKEAGPLGGFPLYSIGLRASKLT